MGKDTVILNGTDSDSLLAFSQKTKKFTVIRIPYPMNVFTRGLDGRIDNPKTGWKGRGLWFDNGIDPIIHSEKQQGFVAHVQYAADPARPVTNRRPAFPVLRSPEDGGAAGAGALRFLARRGGARE